MPSLKDLKLRIQSVKSTRSITKAMQLVAASKMKKAQDAAVSSRIYSRSAVAVLTRIQQRLAFHEDVDPVYFKGRPIKKELLIVITGERGLCGDFNASAIRMAKKHIDAAKECGRDIQLLCIGRKGHDSLCRAYPDITSELHAHADITASFISDLSWKLLEQFDEGVWDSCQVICTEFVNALVRKTCCQQVLPLQLDEGASGKSESDVYRMESNLSCLLPSFLTSYMQGIVFSAILESCASEQGARMKAMDDATNNASELIDNLTLVYNRTRQATITKELIEIVSGAEMV